MAAPITPVNTDAPEGVATEPVGQSGIRVDITESDAATAGSAAGFVALRPLDQSHR